VNPLGPRLPLADLAVWTGSALVIWLFLGVLLGRLGSRASAIAGALVSWLLARVLVFGVPETDDVGVSFWCTQQSGIVRLYIPESDPKLKSTVEVNFKLEVAGKTYPLKGKTALNEESTGTSLETELKTTDSVFAALEEANHFAVKVGSSIHVFPLGEADFQSFLDVCGKP